MSDGPASGSAGGPPGLERAASSGYDSRRCRITGRLRTLCYCSECLRPESERIEERAAQEAVWVEARHSEREQELEALRSSGRGQVASRWAAAEELASNSSGSPSPAQLRRTAPARCGDGVASPSPLARIGRSGDRDGGGMPFARAPSAASETSSDPSAGEWEAVVADDGRQYFWNRATDAVSWVDPALEASTCK